MTHLIKIKRFFFIAIALIPLVCLPTVVLAAFEIYVADAGSFMDGPWKIFKTDENGGNSQLVTTQNLAWPHAMVFIEDENVMLVSNSISGRINRHNAETGAYIDIFAFGLGEPTRMKIGPDNLLYVVQSSGNSLVRRFQLDGTVVDDFTSVAVPGGKGLDWDSNGNLYVSSFDDSLVRKFDTNGNDMGLFIPQTQGQPTNILFNDNGDLLVVTFVPGGVDRYSSSGAFIERFISGSTRSDGVALLPNGNILLGDTTNNVIRMYSSEGVFIEDLITSTGTGLQQPSAIFIREVSGSSNLTINSGFNDAWFDLATPGQGFFITVFPELGLVFLAWFTFDTELPDESAVANLGWAGHRWLTALGPITGDTAVLDIELTSGGIFDSAEPVPSQQANGGTITLKFIDCENGTLTYNIPGIGTGVIQLVRLANDNVARCVEMTGG